MKNGYPPGLMPDRLPAGLDAVRTRTGTFRDPCGIRLGSTRPGHEAKPDMKVETAGL